MDITPRISADRQVIQTYGGGVFRISQERYDGPVLVFPERTLAWTVNAVSELSVESLHDVRDADITVDLLLLGCGQSIAPVPPALRDAVREWGVVIEQMDTGAACRTYNVLMYEERRVAAALIPIS